MARNGSGTFNRLYDWTDDAAAGTKISSTRMDAEMDGMATALTDSIAKDGQTTPTANLPMGTFRHTGVGAATARTDYARTSQAQDDAFHYAAAGGTVDAITIALAPAVTAYTAGLRVKTFAAGANTGAVTLNVNGVGAQAVKKGGGSALVAGDIPGAGYPLYFEHDGTDWELVNPAPVTVAGTQTVTGDKTFSGTTTFSGTANMSAKAFNTAVRVDVASAATVDLDAAASNYPNITGTTTVTAVTLTNGRVRHCRADGALPITTGASLIINGLASGTTHTFAAGDMFVAVGEPSGVVRIVSITRASGGADGLLSTTTASSAAAADVVLPAGFRFYTIEFDGTVATDGATLQARISQDGGASYKAGASEYEFAVFGKGSDGVDYGTSSVGNTEIRMALLVGNAATEGFYGSLTIRNPASAALHKVINFQVGASDSSAVLRSYVGSGFYNADANAINAIRIMASTGNISGTFKLYGRA